MESCDGVILARNSSFYLFAVFFFFFLSSYLFPSRISLGRAGSPAFYPNRKRSRWRLADVVGKTIRRVWSTCIVEEFHCAVLLPDCIPKNIFGWPSRQNRQHGLTRDSPN